MIKLEYFNGSEWVGCGIFHNEMVAWLSLGGDDFNYRTVNSVTLEVITDKSGGNP